MEWLLRHCSQKVCEAQGQRGERRRLGLEAGTQGKPEIGTPSGRTVALEPVREGGEGESGRGWQPPRPPCHPQQKGRGDKRIELSDGSWAGGQHGTRA